MRLRSPRARFVRPRAATTGSARSGGRSGRGVEIGDTARVGDGHEPFELPVVTRGQRNSLFVREAPENVGGDRAAEMGVQFGEALFDML